MKLSPLSLLFITSHFSSIAIAVSGAYFGPGIGSVFLDGLQCNMSEPNLGYCDKKPFGVNNCTHSEDASLMCVSKNFISEIITLSVGDGGYGDFHTKTTLLQTISKHA